MTIPITDRMSDHAKGLLITTAGVLAITPDSLLIRLIEADSWTILFWRGLLTAAGIAGLMLLLYGRAAPARFRDAGRPGLLVAVLFTGSTIFFVNALTLTSVANTLVIVAASPVFAALLSRIFLGERAAARTWIAMIVVIGAVGLIVSGGFEGGRWVGDFCALGTSICVAGSFVVTRHARASDMSPAISLSGLLTALAAWPLAAPLSVDGDSMLLLVLLGLILTVGFALMMIGPRYITAPEVSLLLPLETVLGTALVWLVLGEEPGGRAIVGGIVVIGTLIIHSVIASRRHGIAAPAAAQDSTIS